MVMMDNLQLYDLVNMTEYELDELFLEAPAPKVKDLNGSYTGRILSGPIFPFNSKFNVDLFNLAWFPWKGKTFTPLSEEKGQGKNRIDFAFINQEMLDFETRIESALFGGSPALVNDYDIAMNLFLLKPMRDEMKKLRDDLYLGRAYMKLGDDYHFIMYFALGR